MSRICISIRSLVETDIRICIRLSKICAYDIRTYIHIRGSLKSDIRYISSSYPPEAPMTKETEMSTAAIAYAPSFFTKDSHQSADTEHRALTKYQRNRREAKATY